MDFFTDFTAGTRSCPLEWAQNELQSWAEIAGCDTQNGFRTTLGWTAPCISVSETAWRARLQLVPSCSLTQPARKKDPFIITKAAAKRTLPPPSPQSGDVAQQCDAFALIEGIKLRYTEGGERMPHTKLMSARKVSLCASNGKQWGGNENIYWWKKLACARRCVWELLKHNVEPSDPPLSQIRASTGAVYYTAERNQVQSSTHTHTDWREK